MCNLCAKNKKSCTQIYLTHINKGFVLCTQNHEINIRVDFFRSLKDLEEEKIYGTSEHNEKGELLSIQIRNSTTRWKKEVY